MEKSNVELREGGYWIGGTRISLDSVVAAFLQGMSPDTIAKECYPILTLEQVYGAITHYLGHRQEMDVYLAQASAESETFWQTTYDSDPQFSRKLADARRQIQMAGQ